MNKNGARPEYSFDLQNLEADLSLVAQKGVTEFVLHDERLASDKAALADFLQAAARLIPDVYISIPARANVLDSQIASLCQKLFCSIDILMHGEAGQKFFFDKKLFSKKASLLNEAGLVFGFLMDFARSEGDSVKAFRERVDFALPLYPNHIEFEQLYSEKKEARNSATFSSQDILWARDVACAISVFYSEGRAVPWFNSVLKPLKIAPSKFFSDFAEWQRCNNCGYEALKKSPLGHKEIEKTQLYFLEEKYCEKRLEHLLPVVADIVKINGSFSRLAGEREETELSLNFNPDDLLGSAAFDIASFSENVCMEECRVKIFDSGGGSDYKIL